MHMNKKQTLEQIINQNLKNKRYERERGIWEKKEKYIMIIKEI